MKIARVKEMQEMDRRAMEVYGIPELVLMENAGGAAVSVLQKEVGLRGRCFAVVCGIGNNGGDGFVVARKVHSLGGHVRVFIVGDPGRIRGAARANLEMVERLALECSVVSQPERFARDLAGVDAIIDGLFGTGLDREVTGFYREVIQAVNGAGRPVLSLDIPSGIHGDTGAVLGVAVRADWTVTFGLPKAGNLLYPGYDFGGRLYVSAISFPPALCDRDDLTLAVNIGPPLLPRDPRAHKGSVGNGLFIAGARGYYGAPYLAAMAFLRAGGGYVRLAAPASIVGFLAQRGVEIVYAPQPETPSGSLSLAGKAALLDLATQSGLAVIGPGLSLEEETRTLVRELVREIPVPLLVDGDGLSAVAGDPSSLKGRNAPTVLTPHPGEMARLTGRSVQEILADPIPLLVETAASFQATVVLKGAHTLIGLADGRVFVNLTGNAGMATAGSGDVLTGAIAAMAGLGQGVQEAVCKGVMLHGLAGDLAAEDRGMDGLVAGDILEYLPRALILERRGEAAARVEAVLTVCS
jgi:NAD(P)H-hydrate epimerase